VLTDFPTGTTIKLMRFSFYLALSVLFLSAFLAGCGSAPLVSPTTSLPASPTTTLLHPENSTAATVSAAPVVTPGVPSISVADAFSLIQANQGNPDFVIVDVRTSDEFNNGHLAGALNIDYYASDFKSNLDKLERAQEYLIYCRTGIRGAAAVGLMLELGFNRVHNLTGGIVQWNAAGYPTTK
jgi:rhodanese-related sulfurtransferase